MGKGGKRPRRTTSRSDRVFIGAWVPKPMAAAVDTATRKLDLDRSKFLCQALRDKLKKEGR